MFRNVQSDEDCGGHIYYEDYDCSTKVYYNALPKCVPEALGFRSGF